MRNILYKINTAMARFMYGRYGTDELSRHLLIGSLVLFILSNFRVLRFLYYLAAIMLIWSLFRSYSKKIDKRLKERHIYLQMKDRSKARIRLWKNMWQERKTYKYVKCASCGFYYRLPKGAGEVIATCPGCGEKRKSTC